MKGAILGKTGFMGTDHFFATDYTMAPRIDLRNLIPYLFVAIIAAAFAVPDAMANTSLAGVPLQLGLYASIMALLAYGIFGTSWCPPRPDRRPQAIRQSTSR